jgi:hypothetical protein
VLRLLARSSDGHTEAMLLTHGFTIAMLAILVHEWFATATPETGRTGHRAIKIVRMRITDAGARRSPGDLAEYGQTKAPASGK